jgi:hypothetical protein
LRIDPFKWFNLFLCIIVERFGIILNCLTQSIYCGEIWDASKWFHPVILLWRGWDPIQWFDPIIAEMPISGFTSLIIVEMLGMPVSGFTSLIIVEMLEASSQ